MREVEIVTWRITLIPACHLKKFAKQIQFLTILEDIDRGRQRRILLRSILEEHVFGTNFVFLKKEPFDDIYRPSYSVLDTEKVCRLNRDKEYLSHWTYALKECVEKIA